MPEDTNFVYYPIWSIAFHPLRPAWCVFNFTHGQAIRHTLVLCHTGFYLQGCFFSGTSGLPLENILNTLDLAQFGRHTLVVFLGTSLVPFSGGSSSSGVIGQHVCETLYLLTYLSLNLVDRWGTKDDRATTVLHSSLFSVSRRASPNFNPVHPVL